jgi:hypothetical protein
MAAFGYGTKVTTVGALRASIEEEIQELRSFATEVHAFGYLGP